MRRRVGLAAITLAAFGLRFHRLGGVPPRWDEGWSIALASLPPRDIIRLTALDVHPPLYYLLLKPWLALGLDDLWVRAPGALAGTLAVPLAAAAARAWWARARAPRGATDGAAALGGADVPSGAVRARRRARYDVGVWAAAGTAVAPAFVYYAGVARMYALTAPLLLLAVWGLARLGAARRGAGPAAVAGALGALGALYTFYYAGIALAGVYAAALAARPRAWRRLVAAAGAVAAAYAPWLAVVAAPLAARLGARAAAEPGAGGGFDWAAVPPAMRDGLYAAFFAYDAGWAAVGVSVLVLGLGFAAGRSAVDRGRAAAIVGLPVAAVLAAAAVGAQAHMLAPRYLIVATPFLVLGLGWAVARLGERSGAAALAAALALAAAVAPTLAGYVYQREAEVDGPWDPAVFWRDVAPRAASGDWVVFNILSVAGLYARYRGPSDAPWGYAQLWDPVHEPVDTAIARVAAGAPRHGRTWLALYKGTVSPGSAALKAWADTHLFPAGGAWAGDVLLVGYVEGRPDVSRALAVDFGRGVRLAGAAHASRAAAGKGIAVALRWEATAVPDANARVFVHAYARDGTLVAQHDGFPAADGRPPKTWAAGDVVDDRHGLWVPPGTPPGPLRLVVGLYDPKTGERWREAGGEDAVEIGVVEVGRQGAAPGRP